jgi:exodeoxyribonuclease V alpha subunit
VTLVRNPVGPQTPTDARDVQQVRRAGGLLARFNRAGVLGAADVHVARRLQRLGDENDEQVLLAAALVVRAVRQGSVCLRVAQAAATTAVDGVSAEDVAALPWPPADEWVATVEASPLVAVGESGPADRPLRFVDGLLYLDRYWRQQQVIAGYVDAATAHPPARPPDADVVRRAGRPTPTWSGGRSRGCSPTRSRTGNGSRRSWRRTAG